MASCPSTAVSAGLVRRPMSSFIDADTRDPGLRKLRDFWATSQAIIAGPNLDRVQIKTAAVGDWWLCWAEGSDMMEYSSLLGEGASQNRMIMTLTASGRFQSHRQPSTVSEANTLSICPFDPAQRARAWGRFGFLTVVLPTPKAFVVASGEVQRPARIAPADFGASAIFASALRAFSREAFRMSRTASIGHVIPELDQLLVKAFDAPVDNGDALFRATTRMERILAYVTENLTDPTLSPRQVAHACGVSERQLYREFAASGRTFGETLRQGRLELAATRLRFDRSSSVSLIAYECGFVSASHFVQAFRSRFASSPQRYRAAANDQAPH